MRGEQESEPNDWSIEDTGSRELATALIDVSEFDPPVQVIEARRTDVGDVLQEGGADAALLFLPLRSDLRDALAGGRYRLVGLHAATALSRDLPGTLVDAIPRGTYGRNRVYPREDLPTLAVNANLVVREDLDPRAIKAVLETVYSAQFVREMPLGLLIDEAWGRQVIDLPLHDRADRFYRRNDPMTADRFEIAAFFLALLIALLTGLRYLVEWRRSRASS